MAKMTCLDCGAPCSPDASCAVCGGGRIGEIRAPQTKRREQDGAADPSVDVTTVAGKDTPRYRLDGMPELERGFGGGGVPKGARVLIAGPPGIGKSTLFLSISGAVARSYPSAVCSVLYVTGEETVERIGGRAKRLGQSIKGIRILKTSQLADAEAAIKKWRPKLAIIDSVPTLTSEADGSGEGSVKQIKTVTKRLSEMCEKQRTTLLLITHVTKDGIPGGPRALEHLVDIFAMFEGDRRTPIRVLTFIKNRDGAAGETVVMEMTAGGLREVPDPASLSLAERSRGTPGSVIFAAAESERPVLLEVEAMVSTPEPADGDEEKEKVAERAPRVNSAVGLPPGRAARLLPLLASAGVAKAPGTVIDVEANVPAGGAFTESAVDLAVAAAVVSSSMSVVIPEDVVVMGSVSVTGRVKSVHRCQARLEAAMSAGFVRAVLPGENVRRGEVPRGMVAVPIDSLSELVSWVTSIAIVPGKRRVQQEPPAPQEAPLAPEEGTN
mgnify:CR=1 FL=1